MSRIEKRSNCLWTDIPVMTMENCPSSSRSGCSGLCGKCERHTGRLKDRKGEVFPYIRYTGPQRTVIFNSYPIFMDDIESLRKTDLSLLRLAFTREDIADSLKIASYYHGKLKKKGILIPGIAERIAEKVIRRPLVQRRNRFRKGYSSEKFLAGLSYKITGEVHIMVDVYVEVLRDDIKLPFTQIPMMREWM